jgi:two-component system response regulator RegA
MGVSPVVMVVDDHETIVSAYVRAFERAGYRTVTASTVTGALATAEATLPTIAVVDLWLAGATGIELVAELRARAPAMRIVLISAAVAIGDAVRATRAGADAVLMKPASVAHILGAEQPLDPTPTLARVEWEYMMRTLRDANNNISEAARRLGIRRQSLQRKLKRQAPPE